MRNDGRRLEALVSFIETWVAKEGTVVRTNVKKFDQGIPIAEFDVVVESQVGEDLHRWLIECRDRLSSGPAPASWIEQLMGRRIAHEFDKVTAVSTTGFATGAQSLAKIHEIELREVRESKSEQFEWQGIQSISLREHVLTPGEAEVMCRKDESPSRKNAFFDAVTGQGANVSLRPFNRNAAPLSLRALFDEISRTLEHEFLQLEAGNLYPLVIDLNYNEAPTYFIETRLGPMAVEQIRFLPKVEIFERDAVVEKTHQYSLKSPEQQEISQKATLRTHSIDGSQFSVEVHRLAGSGKLRLLLDRIG